MSDRVDSMQAFVAVCDARGFAAAARRLNRSPSVISRLVAALEERLGARLLQRTTRAVKLTDAGERYLERARSILAAIEEAELSAQDELAAPRGRLVVSAPVLFGRMHVAPLLSHYLGIHPQVRAELELTDRFVQLIEEGVDVAIRLGTLPDSGLITRRLAKTRRVLVASPEYLSGPGAPHRPEDLAVHQMIAFRSIIAGSTWRFMTEAGDELAIELEAHFATNSGEAAIEHALRGGGVTAAFSYQIEAALAAGELVEVLRNFSPPAAPIQAVFPSSRLLSTKVRCFLSLAEEAARKWRFARHEFSGA